MTETLFVAAGAFVGAPVRYLLGQRFDGLLPWGTLVVNTVASFVLGACVGWSLDGAAFALVGVGFCGGMSTYSSFVVQARDHGLLRGTAYVVLTVGLGLAAAALGYGLAQA